ncbi:hypothetical protein [Sporomusa termitida]|uniref:Uncharacterized protein n=1 Tax=Sporomusa termitida TaxID=2377 RepID=A0A517DQ93_9FIRM|nr:hypothetical protein [Sporomusa termitida]QDR79530.1 hypothetical protein SPTER_08050 [Sporomusa termitida]
MKMFSLRIFLVLSLLAGLGAVGSVGAAKAPSANPAANVMVEQWVGHNFTFLALPVDKQAAGYEIFIGEEAVHGFQGDRSVRIPYAEYVGKQITVTGIVPFPAGYNQKEYIVTMTVDDTGEKLAARTMRGQLEGLVLTSDLTNARQQFLGTTVYPKFRDLSGLYWTNTTMPRSVSLPIGSPVTVVDVYAGNQSQKPIWLIVSVNGEKAILPIAYSWTNTPVEAWTEAPPWQADLFAADPKISLGGSYALWAQIENGDIEEGMTKEQVHLSWGKPMRTEKNDSVWLYGTKRLTFHGVVLASIETLSETNETSIDTVSVK